MSSEALADASSVLSRHAGTIVLGHLIVGALALSVIEGWGPSDSLYFCVTTRRPSPRRSGTKIATESSSRRCTFSLAA